MTKDWEKSFLPLDAGGIPPDEVACDHCGTLRSLTDMTEVKKQGSVEPINLRFCNQDCANEWYIAFLRSAEGGEQIEEEVCVTTDEVPKLLRFSALLLAVAAGLLLFSLFI